MGLGSGTAGAAGDIGLALRDLDSSKRFKDGYLASIWGSMKSKVENNLSADGITFRRIEVPTDLFRNGTFRLRMSLEGGAAPKKAPLVVVLAGLFSSSESDLPQRYLRALRKRGYHVLVVSNSWSSHYLEQGPKFKPVNFPFEARVVLDSVAIAIERFIGASQVDGVSLLGESYGGFLSSVVLALDKKNLFSKGALVLGPPVNLQMSMLRLDGLIKETRSQRECLNFWSQFGFTKDLILAGSDVSVSQSVRHCAKAIFAKKGFQSGLKDAALRLDRDGLLKLEESERNALTFSAFVNHFVFPGGTGKPNPRNYDLGYWLSIARNRNPALPVRIISAQDDPLNSLIQWNENQHFRFDSANLALLQWGGHMGYVMSPEFQKVLDSIYGEATSFEASIPAVSF